MRNLLDPLANLLIFAIDDMIGTKFAGEARLIFTANHAYDAQVRGLRQVDQRIAHAAGRGVDEYGLALPQLQGIVEHVIRDLVVGERGRCLVIDVVGRRKVASTGAVMYSA